MKMLEQEWKDYCKLNNCDCLHDTYGCLKFVNNYYNDMCIHLGTKYIYRTYNKTKESI